MVSTSSERPGTLYLVPNTLGATPPQDVIPAAVLERVRVLRHFVAENEKSARALLKSIGVTAQLRELSIERLDHNTAAARVPELLVPLLAGHDVGLVSEAGLPAVADPGAALVRLAHERGIRVTPLAGPSSITLALAASGLNGQRFAFRGYLPVDAPQLNAALVELERDSRRLEQTQIFIETPYRNERTLAAALRALAPATLVCVAAELTLPGEEVRTRTVAQWRAEPPALTDRPTVFLVLAAS
jgi:16S rRNA (cytidine1402-2'-O)-methyltransferase